MSVRLAGPGPTGEAWGREARGGSCPRFGTSPS